MWAKFFPSKAKTPDDVVKALRESLREARDARDRDASPHAPHAHHAAGHGAPHDDVSKWVHALKVMLFGDAGNDVDVKAADVADVVRLACDGDLLLLLASNLSAMQFETRKDAVQIFNNLLRRDADEATGRCSATKVAERDGEVLRTLVTGYRDGDIALNCGHILRECIRHEALATLMLHGGLFWHFFDLVELSDFDVASDAFATFKECLVRHVAVSARFIEAHMGRFVTSYNALLRSPNYVTRRQSLKLLGEMLLERANFRVMTHYIASPPNLRLVMNLLLDNRRNIQFEAFHVFKIFVANPHKPADVQHILVRNKHKMLAYLADFLSDRDDDQFQEDRQLVLQEIRSLPDAEPPAAPGGSELVS